jgi:hypothetical protein
MTRDYIDDTDLTARLNSLFKVCKQTDRAGRQADRQAGRQVDKKSIQINTIRRMDGSIVRRYVDLDF